MNLFFAELKKTLHPMRILALLCVWAAVFGMYASSAFSDVDLAVSKRACELVTEYYGTHLDADERERLDAELLGTLMQDIDSRIAVHPAFVAAEVADYEAYRFLVNGKSWLSNMNEEEFGTYTDEDLMREFGVTREVDRTLSEAEIALLNFDCPEADKAKEIAFLGRVYSRIEDWTQFWYDDRDRLSELYDTDAFDYEIRAMQRYFTTDEYTGNMPSEVSETVGKAFRAAAVGVVCSCIVLCCVSPAHDRIVQVNVLQTVTKRGRKILHTQAKTAMLIGLLTALFAVAANAVFLHALIPDLLWNNPLNSYQSFFTVYYFGGTLRQYFWLCAMLLVLLAIGVTAAGFAFCSAVKSYTGLLGVLIPVWFLSVVTANTVFKMPFSCRQSLQGTYLSDLIPFAYSEIAICILFAVVGIALCAFFVRKRECEMRKL